MNATDISTSINHTFKIKDKSLQVQIWNGNGWDFSQARYDCPIMLNLIACYLNNLDSDYLSSGHISIIRSSEDFPRLGHGTTKENRTILLSVDNLFWCQQVYQLAHELTHYFLGTNAEEANNWFYESIAETASLYFLEKFASDTLQYSQNQDFKEYAPNFIQYKNDRLAEITDIEEPPIWFVKHSKILAVEKTNRSLNNQCAKLLLPYFEKIHGSWNILFFAPQSNHPLSTLIEEWKNNCPVASWSCILDRFQEVFFGNNNTH